MFDVDPSRVCLHLGVVDRGPEFVDARDQAAHPRLVRHVVHLVAALDQALFLRLETVEASSEGCRPVANQVVTLVGVGVVVGGIEHAAVDGAVRRLAARLHERGHLRTDGAPVRFVRDRVGSRPSVVRSVGRVVDDGRDRAGTDGDGADRTQGDGDDESDCQTVVHHHVLTTLSYKSGTFVRTVQTGFAASTEPFRAFIRPTEPSKCQSVRTPCARPTLPARGPTGRVRRHRSDEPVPDKNRKM